MLKEQIIAMLGDHENAQHYQLQGNAIIRMNQIIGSFVIVGGNKLQVTTIGGMVLESELQQSGKSLLKG